MDGVAIDHTGDLADQQWLRRFGGSDDGLCSGRNRLDGRGRRATGDAQQDAEQSSERGQARHATSLPPWLIGAYHDHRNGLVLYIHRTGLDFREFRAFRPSITVFSWLRVAKRMFVRCMYKISGFGYHSRTMLAPHIAVVSRAITDLDQAIQRLIDALSHQPLWLQLPGVTQEAEARERLCTAYGTIDYEMEDEAGRTETCLGVVGVSAEVRLTAEAVNRAKAALKSKFVPLQRQQVRVAQKGPDGTNEKIPVLRAVLRQMQRSNLNIHAAYRKIPLLGAAPERISFTRARTRSVYRKSIEDIQTILMNQDGPYASADRARLETLGPGETHLALVREHYENVRANVTYHGLDRRGRGRVQIGAELPLMYTASKRFAPPEIRFPGPSAEASEEKMRQPRASKIEAEPFLRSLSVHRYSR